MQQLSSVYQYDKVNSPPDFRDTFQVKLVDHEALIVYQHLFACRL